jgi:RNA polymerase sigma factor (sigma-70 family)
MSPSTSRQLHRLREPAAFDAWVHRITVRKTTRAMTRRRLRRAREGGDELLFQAADPHGVDPAEDLALQQAMRRALAGLPVKQRLAVVLRYVHDLSEAQIAAALGCAPGTAGSLLSRARTQLRLDAELVQITSEEGVPR